VRQHVGQMKRAISSWKDGVPLNTVETDLRPPTADNREPLSPEERPNPTSRYESGLSPLFALFDAFPGQSPAPLSHSGEDAGVDASDAELLDFLCLALSSSGPTLLPSDAPSLAILDSQCIWEPLLAYARLVSSSLLVVFFRDLELEQHLEILKSFVLFGQDAYTRRFKAALFSGPEAADGATLVRRRRRRPATEANWGAGLGSALNDRSVWPPGGAELSIALRTVLIDSIAELRCEGSSAWNDLESRLSFAVRDLDEHDETTWLDPQCTHAALQLVLKLRLCDFFHQRSRPSISFS
jgi:hypothetical protein